MLNQMVYTCSQTHDSEVLVLQRLTLGTKQVSYVSWAAVHFVHQAELFDRDLLVS